MLEMRDEFVRYADISLRLNDDVSDKRGLSTDFLADSLGLLLYLTFDPEVDTKELFVGCDALCVSTELKDLLDDALPLLYDEIADLLKDVKPLSLESIPQREPDTSSLACIFSGMNLKKHGYGDSPSALALATFKIP